MKQQRLSPLRGFIAATVILIVLGVYVVANAIQLASDYRLVNRTHEVLNTLMRIDALKHQAVAESRGYILGKREENRDNFLRVEGQIRDEADALVMMLVDNPPQRARSVAVREALDRRLAVSSEGMDVFRTTGIAPTASAERVAMIRAADALVNDRIDALRQEERILLAKRSQRTERSAWLVLLAAGIGIPLSLLLIGQAHRRLGRENRIRAQAEAAASKLNSELTTTVSQLARLSDSMAALSAYSGMLQGASDAQELYEITATTFRRLLPDVSGFLYVIRASRDQAELAAQWNGSLAPNDPNPSPHACWAVRRSMPFAVEDMRNGLRCPHTGRPSGADDVCGVCIPISAQGDTIGWMSLQARAHGRFDNESLAVSLCEQLGLALANVRLRERLQHQAIRDPLTGLFNRRYLEESLSREIARCQRREQPLAVMMLDVDHFKAFNDRHGHATGDVALAAFGELLQSKCRAEDIACRYGGEEFTLILPETDLDTALARAEDIRASVALLPIGDRGTMPRITVSIGLALMPDHGDVGLALLRAGDVALYRAKHEGRDRVVVAPMTPGETTAGEDAAAHARANASEMA